MYRNILVPLDGSEVAECVLPHVEAIALKDQSVNVIFLYVVEPFDVPLTDQTFKRKIESEGKSAAKDYLNDAVQKISHKGTLQSKVVVGKPADSIIDYANKNSVDLIIMATHGRSGVDRWVRGSVADKVLHAATIPVWLVRAGVCEDAPYAKSPRITLLVTLDGSDVAESAIDHAEMLTKQLGTDVVDIVLVRVCELFTQPFHYPPPMSLSWEEYLKYETKRCMGICQEYLKGVEKKLQEQGFNVRSEVLTGKPADGIIDYANKNPVNMIVMSTHGRSGIGRWAFGSITEKVLMGASRPIFLVRQR